MSLWSTPGAPTRRQLRQFGFIGLAALPALGWWWSGGAAAATGWCAALGGSMGLAAWLRPQSLGPAFHISLLITRPIGFVVGELAVAAIYYLIVTPLGLLQRLCGRSRLDLRIDPPRSTYWTERPPHLGPESYRRQW